MFWLLAEYREIHGDCSVPKGYVVEASTWETKLIFSGRCTRRARWMRSKEGT